MIQVKRLVLDILKPHQPNALDFARAIAAQGADYRVHLTVQEVDEKTESIQLVIEGNDIQFEAVAETISSHGASLHSIDEVEVCSHSHPGSGE
ncbi:MAG: DUF211 domain-containing protein [Candidatus Tectomicrobia bacterium]|nr:DUF211 domain-containing protein [Candidatus Tectomicrobia bacterium]